MIAVHPGILCPDNFSINTWMNTGRLTKQPKSPSREDICKGKEEKEINAEFVK
tara:strand:- start:9 stop:167 length:159 start_codon:yes stop_codon:yes gene_type:complete